MGVMLYEKAKISLSDRLAAHQTIADRIGDLKRLDLIFNKGGWHGTRDSSKAQYLPGVHK